MPHVVLSTTVCQRGKSGVAAYLFGLIEGLVRLDNGPRLTLLGFDEDRPLFERWLDRAEWSPIEERWRPAVRDILWHQVFLRNRLRELRAEVLHIPSYRRIVHSPGVPQVVTVHDCAAFHVRGKYDRARMLYGTHVVPRLAARADRIITVSQATAVDVERFMKRPLDRIDVVWNGIDHGRLAPPTPEAALEFRRRLGLERPYIVYLARLEHPAKNHLRLIEAFELLAKQNPDFRHDLVLAGADWHGAELVHARVAASPLRGRIRTPGFVEAADLPLWYGCAELLAYPSLFEGFGLPPIEAMACGCPVVCSDRGSLGEVTGGAARIVDPESVPDIASGLLEVASNREGWRKSGIARAAEFDWNTTARRTAAIYREASGT